MIYAKGLPRPASRDSRTRVSWHMLVGGVALCGGAFDPADTWDSALHPSEAAPRPCKLCDLALRKRGALSIRPATAPDPTVYEPRFRR